MMKKLDVNGVDFELPDRYEPIKMVGKGTYGAVISAVDHHTKEKVAIKKLTKIEDMVTQKLIQSSFAQIDAKRVLREIKIMKNLRHENILSLINVVYVPKET